MCELEKNPFKRTPRHSPNNWNLSIKISSNLHTYLETWPLADKIQFFLTFYNLQLNKLKKINVVAKIFCFNSPACKKGLKCIGRVGTPTRASSKAHPLMSWDYNEEHINNLKKSNKNLSSKKNFFKLNFLFYSKH